MVIKNISALMAFEEDIRNRGFMDWLIAHTSFFKPLHRYEGILLLMNDKLVFEGIDKKKKQKYQLQISKTDVISIFHGFDDIFKRGEDRALGLSFKPLRINFRQNGSCTAIYLIIEFRRALRTSKNKECYNELSQWLGSFKK
ncbi:hypothetical protein ACFL96_12305 [Thermoproteota archaeon]